MKEYKANGVYSTNEDFTSYISVSDKYNTLSSMSYQNIAIIINKTLSINEAASLLSSMSELPENILRISKILLLLPIEKVYSIIPTMTIKPSKLSISTIVLILLNMPISTIALIISNMKIPQMINIPTNNNKSSVINFQKSIILSDYLMPSEKAAMILSDPNISDSQAAYLLLSMSKEKSLEILSKMINNKASIVSSIMKKCI